MKEIIKAQKALLLALEKSGMFLNGSEAGDLFAAAKKALTEAEKTVKK